MGRVKNSKKSRVAVCTQTNKIRHQPAEIPPALANLSVEDTNNNKRKINSTLFDANNTPHSSSSLSATSSSSSLSATSSSSSTYHDGTLHGIPPTYFDLSIASLPVLPAPVSSTSISGLSMAQGVVVLGVLSAVVSNSESNSKKRTIRELSSISYKIPAPVMTSASIDENSYLTNEFRQKKGMVDAEIRERSRKESNRSSSGCSDDAKETNPDADYDEYDDGEEFCNYIPNFDGDTQSNKKQKPGEPIKHCEFGYCVVRSEIPDAVSSKSYQDFENLGQATKDNLILCLPSNAGQIGVILKKNSKDRVLGVMLGRNVNGNNCLSVRCMKCLENPQIAVDRTRSKKDKSCKDCYKFFHNSIKTEVKNYHNLQTSEKLKADLEAKDQQRKIRTLQRAAASSRRDNDSVEWRKLPGNSDFDLKRFGHGEDAKIAETILIAYSKLLRKEFREEKDLESYGNAMHILFADLQTLGRWNKNGQKTGLTSKISARVMQHALERLTNIGSNNYKKLQKNTGLPCLATLLSYKKQYHFRQGFQIDTAIILAKLNSDRRSDLPHVGALTAVATDEMEIVRMLTTNDMCEFFGLSQMSRQCGHPHAEFTNWLRTRFDRTKDGESTKVFNMFAANGIQAYCLRDTGASELLKSIIHLEATHAQSSMEMHCTTMEIIVNLFCYGINVIAVVGDGCQALRKIRDTMFSRLIKDVDPKWYDDLDAVLKEVTAIAGIHPITGMLMVALGDPPHVFKNMSSVTLNKKKDLAMKVDGRWCEVQGEKVLWRVVQAREGSLPDGSIRLGARFFGGHISRDVIIKTKNGAMNVRAAILGINRHPQMILKYTEEKCNEVRAKVSAGIVLSEEEQVYNYDPIVNKGYLIYAEKTFELWEILNNRAKGLTGDRNIDGTLIDADIFKILSDYLIFFINWEKDCIERSRLQVVATWDDKELSRVAALPPLPVPEAVVAPAAPSIDSAITDERVLKPHSGKFGQIEDHKYFFSTQTAGDLKRIIMSMLFLVHYWTDKEHIADLTRNEVPGSFGMDWDDDLPALVHEDDDDDDDDEPINVVKNPIFNTMGILNNARIPHVYELIGKIMSDVCEHVFGENHQLCARRRQDMQTTLHAFNAQIIKNLHQGSSHAFDKATQLASGRNHEAIVNDSAHDLQTRLDNVHQNNVDSDATNNSQADSQLALANERFGHLPLDYLISHQKKLDDLSRERGFRSRHEPLMTHDDLKNYAKNTYLPADMTTANTTRLPINESFRWKYFGRLNAKAHQLSGAKTLCSMLTGQHQGGILADYMGLGKTFTFMMAMNVVLNELNGNGIIFCPKVVVSQTTVALRRWLGMSVAFCTNVDDFISLIVPPAKRNSNVRTQTILVAQYEHLTESFLAKIANTSIELVVYDEMHICKNVDTIAAKNGKLLNERVKRVLGISGTIVSNNFDDLQNLINFTIDGYLPSDIKEFKDAYPYSVAGARLLGEKVKPVVVRRTFADVADIQLPKRTFVNVYIHTLSPIQEEEYAELIENHSSSFFSVTSEAQKICNISRLIADICLEPQSEIKLFVAKIAQDEVTKYSDVILDSSKKIQMIVKMIETMKRRDSSEKMIIISHLTEYFLNLLEIVLIDMEIGYCYIGDGRKDTIETFRDSRTQNVLLLSEKAGGVGINASFAKTIIKVDSSKGDPSVSDQACGRNYRLDQVIETFEYRLIASNRIDEAYHIQEMKKRAINGIVMGDPNVFIPSNIDEDEEIVKGGKISYYLTPGTPNIWESTDPAWQSNPTYDRTNDPLLCDLNTDDFNFSLVVKIVG